MRLVRYINESNPQEVSDDIEEIRSILIRDCGRYIKEVGGSMLYRGFGYSSPLEYDKLYKKRVRKDRIPRGTDDEAFVRVNEWLDKNGYARRDRSVIVTPSIAHASEFGYVGVILPIGRYKYSWVESRDFNYTGNKGWYSHTAEEAFIEGREDSMEAFERSIHKKDIMSAIRQKYEIWIECDSYYIVSERTYKGMGI